MKDCYALNGSAVDSGAQQNLNDNPTSLVKAHLGMVDALAKQLMQQYSGCPWRHARPQPHRGTLLEGTDHRTQQRQPQTYWIQ